MSNFPNIFDHIGSLIHKAGNFKPFLPAPESSGPNQLADLDFRTPATSTGFASANETQRWDMQSNTAGSFANGVGSATLDDDGDGGIYDRPAIGLWDGSGFDGWGCWEATGQTTQLVCSSTTVGDSTQKISYRMVIRWTHSSSGEYVISKTTGFGAAGWSCYTATSGRLVFYYSDGTTNVTQPTTVTGMNNGAWHAFDVEIDPGVSMKVKINGVEDADVDLSSANLGSGNANAIVINGLPGGLSGSVTGLFQLAYLGIAEGTTEAAAYYAEDYWQHGGDPTSLLTTIDRDCLISVPLSDSTVGHFAPNQLPIGQHGLFCNSAATNLIPNSENFGAADWTKSPSMTITAAAADSPDGFRSAYEALADGANNEDLTENVAASDSTTYTLSVWVKESTSAAEVTLDLIDLANGNNNIGTLTFNATSSWQRYTVTGTMGTGVTNISSRIRIVNNGESAYLWGVQLEEGSEAGAYIRTDGAPASLVAPDYQVAEAHNTTAGRIEMTSRLVERKNTTCYYFANTGTDRKEISQGGNMGSLVQIGSTISVSNFIRAGEPVGVEVISLLRWDNDLGFEEDGTYSATASSGGGILRTGTATGTPGGTSPDLIIGKRTAGTEVDAWIKRIRIFDGPGAEATV